MQLLMRQIVDEANLVWQRSKTGKEKITEASKVLRLDVGLSVQFLLSLYIHVLFPSAG